MYIYIYVIFFLCSLIQGIVARIGQVALAIRQQQQQIVLAPGLVETYSRLLVYMEIELLGIKGFIGRLIFFV